MIVLCADWPRRLPVRRGLPILLCVFCLMACQASSPPSVPQQPTPQDEHNPKVPITDSLREYWQAARVGDVVQLKISLARGVPINVADQAGATALHHAVTAGQYETTVFLLQRGADPNLGARNGVTPLMIAVDHENLALTRLLLEHDANVNLQDERGRTALMAAANRGNLEIVRLLLHHHADVNLRTREGETALSRAETNGHLAIAKLLEEVGAK